MWDSQFWCEFKVIPNNGFAIKTILFKAFYAWTTTYCREEILKHP